MEQYDSKPFWAIWTSFFWKPSRMGNLHCHLVAHISLISTILSIRCLDESKWYQRGNIQWDNIFWGCYCLLFGQLDELNLHSNIVLPSRAFAFRWLYWVYWIGSLFSNRSDNRKSNRCSKWNCCDCNHKYILQLSGLSIRCLESRFLDSRHSHVSDCSRSCWGEWFNCNVRSY